MRENENIGPATLAPYSHFIGKSHIYELAVNRNLI